MHPATTPHPHRACASSSSVYTRSVWRAWTVCESSPPGLPRCASARRLPQPKMTTLTRPRVHPDTRRTHRTTTTTTPRCMTDGLTGGLPSCIECMQTGGLPSCIEFTGNPARARESSCGRHLQGHLDMRFGWHLQGHKFACLLYRASSTLETTKPCTVQQEHTSNESMQNKACHYAHYNL